MIGFAYKIKSNLYIVRDWKVMKRVVDITSIVRKIVNNTVDALIAFHCWSGCDTVSSFLGQGKKKG